MNFHDLIDPILHNQVVTGLSFTAVLGAAAYQLRNIPHMMTRGTLRFLTVELTVTGNDPSFDWMDRWLANQPYAKRAKMLTLRSGPESTVPTYPPPDEAHVNWSLSPGPGLHVFWWRKRPVFLERSYLTKEGDDARRNKPIETLRFRTIGRSQAIIRRLIADVREFSMSTNMVSLRVWSEHYWLNIPAKSPRPLDSIILPNGQVERITDDLHWFIKAREWYRQRGIPYRRGYLFAGEPGTGKTSLVIALAGYLNRPICILTIGSDIDDNSMLAAFNEAPANAIILIEDVDCAFPAQSRETAEKKEGGRLTKAGLLNAIDGVATPDGRIVIMTTNYPDRLDPALVRPGRADVHEHFYLLGPSDQQRMARRFYDQHFSPVIQPVSPALLQGVFMLHPDDPQAAHRALVAAMA
jgi:chaperone BCS1